MENEIISLRNLAHLGDAVWELFVREYTVKKTSNIKKLHNITCEHVNASFQQDMLNLIFNDLTEEEHEIVKRARNLPIPIARRNIQKQYRQATAFETIIGYWYLYNKPKLQEKLNWFLTTEFFS